MPKRELPKAYNSADYEDAIYEKWEKSGFLNPDNLPAPLLRQGSGGQARLRQAGLKSEPACAKASAGEPYSIMMPPPNVTGVLHLGHALENSLMDIMARYQRMNGKKVLLLPGTDHAAVATQAKVEKVLIAQGVKNPRQELGREKLLLKIREYAEDSKSTILKQIRKMGTSCDWSRLAYTFDEARNRAVNEVFVKMYNDGLIYRGRRIINWDAKLQTTISDDEIVWQEEKAPYYYLKYGPFIISTARPETKFGDKYVVMHPDDKRYKKYKHGDKFECEWINGKVTATIIKDKAIDSEFGTGVMTITPWHSMVDFEIAERHGLKGEQIIDFNGKLLPVAGEFSGMSILEARPRIAEKLKAKGLVEKVDENYIHRVSKGDRSNSFVEPQIKEQWFVAVNKKIPRRDKSLKDLMREAVTTGHNNDPKQKVKITPERFEKTYLNWINNLRDWCISRQIWWGHRIPVYYRKQGISNFQFSISNENSSVKVTYFVHGTTSDNEAGKSSGHYDVELSDLGIKQAKELAKTVSERKFDIVFCSDLKRAVDTAKLAFGQSAKIIKDKRLRECDYGKMTRKNEKQVQKMEKGAINEPFPGGESYHEVEIRLKDFLNDLMEKYQGKRVAIVAHKGPQLALEVLLKNKTWEQAFDEDWRKKKAWQAGWDYEVGQENQKAKKQENNKEEIYVGAEAPEGDGWTQDEDTLDTWFSSGLWTFSTLGWPACAKASAGEPAKFSDLPQSGASAGEPAKKKSDLSTFHPTSWMQMGYEILFFWMARMILMSTYVLDQIPFKDVYIHGMLRNEAGKKFSKSSGDNIDPLEIIKKYGTDALRLSVISGIAPGNDSKFYEEKVEGARNLVNKLWNISRYIITNYELRITNEKIKIENLVKTVSDDWIITNFNSMSALVKEDLENYRFSQAIETLSKFTWDYFADWYLEISKLEKNKDEILSYILIRLLKLWHPFIPFVTEAIWQELGGKGLLMVEKWPTPLTPLVRGEKNNFEVIKEIIIAIRNARAENKVDPARKIKAVIYAGKKKKLIEGQAHLIKGLRTGIGELEIKGDREKYKSPLPPFVKGGNSAIYAAVGEIEIYLIGAVDGEKEKVRLEKEIANLEKVIKAAENKLANKEFAGKAPAEIVKKEKDKLAGWRAELKKFKEQMKNLK